MKWTLKLVAESDSGETTVHEVAILKRMEAFIKPASLGMSIEESKQIAANIQACMVSDQVDRHNRALTACRFCGACSPTWSRQLVVAGRPPASASSGHQERRQQHALVVGPPA